MRGPGAAYRSDDKRDLVFDVRKAPKISREELILEASVWGGMSAFERQQRSNATRWAEDPPPSVRTWATRIEESFRHPIEEEEAHREYRRKYG